MPPMKPISSVLGLVGVILPLQTQGEINQVQSVVPGVYFHEGDLLKRGHCNNGWVVFEDYVLVIDGNFPSGAQEVIPKIKASADKPIRFVFDTHHHGDHAYGNQVWHLQGATPVAHLGVLDEMRKYESGYFGGQPGRWEDAAKGRPDVAASQLKPPSLLFRKDLVFDDGKRRVELLHFGVAHTQGDGFAWLPKEKILFTGDACVNGPFNYMGDGNSEEWIKTLEAVGKLGAEKVCPGHGPMGGPELIVNQRAFFVELRKEVKKIAGKKPAEAKAAVPQIKARLQQQPAIAKFVGEGFPGQVEKVYVEMGGKPFSGNQARFDSQEQHAHGHGKELATDTPLLRLPNARP
jgi:cyclase